MIAAGNILHVISIRAKVVAVAVFVFGLMLQRRRAQGRNGARRWILTRNLHDITVWTESFRTPTWHDYLRFNYRRTAADRVLNDSLADLHRGEGAPEVTLSIERPTAVSRKPNIFRSDTPHA